MGVEPVVSFVVPGDPKPKGRPRFAKGRAYTPEATRSAEQRVLAAFNLAYPEWTPLAPAVRLRADVLFYRSTRRRVDSDNLLKLVTDALNGRLFVDDEQLDDVRARRYYGAGDEACTVARFYRVEA